AALSTSLVQAGREVGAFDHAHEFAFPDVPVLVRPMLKVSLPISLKLRRELRVVPPVHLHDANEWVVGSPESLLYRGILALGVPCHPKLSVPVLAFLAKRRNQGGPSIRRYRLGLIHPTQEDPTLGLDAGDVAVKAGKGEGDSPVTALDVLLAYVEIGRAH